MRSFLTSRPLRNTALAAGGSAITFIVWTLLRKDKREATSLSINHFTEATLLQSEQSGGCTKLITLKLPPECTTRQKTGTVWSVYIRDDDIQVERPYTPLEGIDKDGRMTFWVKKYPNGEVARWLHSKFPGDKIGLRGPHTTWDWKDQDAKHIIMISGGTGFTPFYQLLYSHFLKKESQIPHTTKLSLLHSSLNDGELPPQTLRNNLEHWRRESDSLTTRLFVDNMGGSSTAADTVGRINRESIEFELRKSNIPLSKTLFLVCGPEPMINTIAGPRALDRTQGPVGGVLGALGCKSHQVWKL
ncbi:ferredoxin reductase-like protein [Rickenella mellea]|uniref:Ferredoxin reductase-like protein n=1 Tax=Rickenella mellea TaxID=50990 RepID=A0A4R5XGD0_9AGAM|nr:ferredoxin reductase-like protein [Rickenella mellea]